jgi:tetratricopeptide (TPR) repeat protein
MHAKAISYTISYIYISRWIIINGVNTMSKRRGFLIRLLLITVIICCSIHTSCGQENDTVNIPPPSSLPAKSDFSQEDILNQAQRSFDRAIDLFNTVATLLGVFVALITLIIVIVGAFGYREISHLKKLNEEAEEYVKEIENKAKEAKKMVDEEAEEYVKEIENKAKETKKIVDEAKEVVGDAKPVFDRLKEIDKNREKTLDPFRERATHLPSVPEPFSEDQKRLLDEYGKKIEFLEAFGVQLKPEDYLSRGDDFYQSSEYELALKAYDKAIELKDDYAVAWNNRGVALDELGRYDEALKAFDKAIELQSDYANAWNNRGVVLGSKSKLRRYDEALEAYKKASQLEPDFAEAWYNQACIYSLKEDKESALKILSEAKDLDAKYKEKAKSDDDFKNLWDDDDFKRIVS